MYDKKIPVSLLEKSLNGVFPKFDEVCIGYGSYTEKRKHTNAFGQDKNVIAFFNDKDNFVNNVWLALDINRKNDIVIAKDMFNAISKLGEFIVADWGWDFIERIDTLKKVEDYLQKRLEIFAKT